MDRTNTITDGFFEGIPSSALAMDEEQFLIDCADLSDMMSETLVVIDFQKEKILHVPQHFLFLYGYTPEKLKKEGYDFFHDALHPDDLPLWKDMYVIILKSLYNNELKAKDIRFLGCTLRIKSFLSEEGEEPEYLMTCLRIKPKFHHDIPVWGICLFSVAVAPKPGNLRVYYKNHDYETYSFKSRKWTFHPSAPLSIRDKQILVWSQQGLSNQQIADKLRLTVKSVEKAKTSLFEELGIVEEQNLTSFSKKFQYAINHCLIYQSPAMESKKGTEKHKK